MIAKVQNHCLLSKPNVKNFLKVRFWSKEDNNSVFNLNKTQYSNLDEFGEAWNATISKGWAGKMTGARKATARQIIYILADRMEKLRNSPDENDQKKYLSYLSDDYDSLPLDCNRQDLVNLMKGGICSKTGYNHVQDLMNMEVTQQFEGKTRTFKFITEKHATSRIKVDGKTVRAANGRGNFQLWISKDLLNFNLNVPNFLNAEKSALGEHQKKNLPQHKSNISIDTKKSIYNNPQGQSGVAKPQNLIKTTLRVDGKHRNENGVTTADKKQIIPREIVHLPDNFDGSPREIIDLFPDSQLVRKADTPTTKLEVYEEKLRKLDRIDKIIPTNSMELAVTVLAALLRRLVFPHLTAKYWKSISSDVEKLLELHILRLESKEVTNNIWKAMQLVARGIYLVHRHIKKQQEKDPYWKIKYTPIPFLRLDLDYAWFKNVMDVWVMNERKRSLATKSIDNSQFMAWQAAFSEAENLFARVVLSMKVKKNQTIGGFSKGMAMAEESQILLKAICKKHNLKEETSQKIMASFSTKIKAIKDELTDKAENEHLEDWDKFFQHFNRA